MRKKRRRFKGSRLILFMSLIISISAMGVGYAAWNDQISMKVNIATGDIDLKAVTREGRIPVAGGEYLDVEVDGKDIIIKGIVYPEFNDELNIDIDIVDTGSVPIILKEVKEDSNDKGVATLDKEEKLFRVNSLNLNEVRESFNLTIRPEVNMNANSSLNTLNVTDEDEIQSLRRQINKLEGKIKEYKNIDEEYKFEYKVLFEQGL